MDAIEIVQELSEGPPQRLRYQAALPDTPRHRTMPLNGRHDPPSTPDEFLPALLPSIGHA